MKITFLVNWDSAAAHALALLAPRLHDVDVSVFYTRNPSRLKSMPQKLRTLAAFEENQLRSQQAIFHKLKAQCLNDINDQDFQKFSDSQPDLVISIRHMSILKSNVIDTPKLGIINLHSGLLPSYQGVMATFWAMKNKEAYLGTTLHFIEDVSIDTGAIIAQSSDVTRFDKSYYWNVLNVYQRGCNNILAAVDSLRIGEQLNAEPQIGKAHYYSFPNDADLNEFDHRLF